MSSESGTEQFVMISATARDNQDCHRAADRRECATSDARESGEFGPWSPRNTSSLDQMIGEVLSDMAVRLRALDTSGETPADIPAEPMADSTASGREQRDDVTRARQRLDLEPSAF